MKKQMRADPAALTAQLRTTGGHVAEFDVCLPYSSECLPFIVKSQKELKKKMLGMVIVGREERDDYDSNDTQKSEEIRRSTSMWSTTSPPDDQYSPDTEASTSGSVRKDGGMLIFTGAGAAVQNAEIATENQYDGTTGYGDYVEVVEYTSNDGSRGGYTGNDGDTDQEEDGQNSNDAGIDDGGGSGNAYNHSGGASCGH